MCGQLPSEIDAFVITSTLLLFHSVLRCMGFSLRHCILFIKELEVRPLLSAPDFSTLYNCFLPLLNAPYSHTISQSVI